MLLALLTTFSLLVTGASDVAPPQDLQGLIRQFESERSLKAHERFATLQKISEIKSRESSEFLAKVIRDSKEETSIVESAIRMVSVHENGIGLEAVVEKGLVQLPERSHWVIRDCWDRDLNDEEVQYMVKTGLGLVSRLPIPAQSVVLKIARKIEDPAAGKALLKMLGNRRIPASNQVPIVEMIRRNRVDGATKKLAKMFKIDDPGLQKEILLALRDLEAQDQSKTFHRALKSPHWPVRAVAADIFGGTRDPEVIGALTPLLRDPFLEVQLAATHALKQIGGREVVEAFIKDFSRFEGRALDDVADALLWLTGEDFGTSKVSWEAWWQSKGKDAEIRGIDRDEFDRIREESRNNTTGTYYGLRVISKFVTFIVDISGSMEEPYEVDTIKLPGGRKGKRGGTGVAEEDEEDAGSRKKEVLPKIEVARRELVRVLDGIPSGTQFNIIPFESSFTPWRPALVQMDDDVRLQSIEFVKQLNPRGMTNVFDTLASALEDPEVNTIYFLSDGAPTMGKITEPQGILDRIRELNSERKVKIHTIGFHLDPGAASLMRRLAEENHGDFVEK
jgi:hypothetical protein